MRVMFRGGSYDGKLIDVDDSLPDYWDMDERKTRPVTNYHNRDKGLPIVIKCTVETYKRKDFYNRGKYTYSEYHRVKL